MPRWIHVQPQGRPRKSCEGHTVSVVERTLYILFGKHEDDIGHIICPPLTMLDTETMILSTPLFDAINGRRTVPPDREGHSAAVIGHRIYIFGGTWCVRSQALASGVRAPADTAVLPTEHGRLRSCARVRGAGRKKTTARTT